MVFLSRSTYTLGDTGCPFCLILHHIACFRLNYSGEDPLIVSKVQSQQALEVLSGRITGFHLFVKIIRMPLRRRSSAQVSGFLLLIAARCLIEDWLPGTGSFLKLIIIAATV
jgi:hypothetical protein